MPRIQADQTSAAATAAAGNLTAPQSNSHRRFRKSPKLITENAAVIAVVTNFSNNDKVSSDPICTSSSGYDLFSAARRKATGAVAKPKKQVVNG